MVSEMNFKPQWEMKNEVSDFDSPLRDEPAFKKHKLVLGSVSPEEDDGINGIRIQNNIGIKHDRRLRKSAQTSSGDELDALDDFKLFAGSLLRDLELTRANLFAQMKDELRKLVVDDTTKQLRRRRNAQAHNRERFEENNRAHCQESVKQDILVQNPEESFEESGLENCFQTLEDLYHYAKVDTKLVSTEKSRGEKLDFHVKPNTQSCPPNHKSFSSDRTSVIRNGFIEGKRRPNPNGDGSFRYNIGYDREFVESIESLGLDFESNIASRPSNQPGSSMNLMQPDALSRLPFLENRRPDILSGNYIQPRVSGHALGMNFNVANHSRFARISSENLASLVPRNNPTSLIGTGFSTSLHRGIESTDTGFGDPRNHVVLTNETSGKSDMSGLSTESGAMNFSGGRNYGL